MLWFIEFTWAAGLVGGGVESGQRAQPWLARESEDTWARLVAGGGREVRVLTKLNQ